MTQVSEVDSTALLDRVALLGVVELVDDETPAHAVAVRRVCEDALAAVDGDVVGKPSAAEVTRALNELEADGYLTATREDGSPSGKGRPTYRLAVDRDALLGELADDESVPELVERVREGN